MPGENSRLSICSREIRNFVADKTFARYFCVFVFQCLYGPGKHVCLAARADSSNSVQTTSHRYDRGFDWSFRSPQSIEVIGAFFTFRVNGLIILIVKCVPMASGTIRLQLESIGC